VEALYVGVTAFGCLLCVVAAAWSLRTRHARKLWRHARHDTTTVAIVLELEEHVHELDRETSLV
jgi:hypothetical protein